MLDSLHIFLALLFGFLAFAVELQYRSKNGMSPSNLSEFILWGQKRRTPDTKYSALIFAVVAVFFFQIWESFVRYLFSVGPHWAWLVGCTAALFALIFFRVKSFITPGAKKGLPLWWLVSFVALISLLLNSWGMLIGVPWVAYRAKFLLNKPTIPEETS